MPNIDSLIGFYNSHVKFKRICSLTFDFEHLYSYLELQLTNSRNSQFSLKFLTQKSQHVDPFLHFYLYV